MGNQIYKLSDDVLARIVQIVQEAFLTGIDCTDLMRQIELVHDEADPTVLTLPVEYMQRVAEGYARMVERAETLRSEMPGLEFTLGNLEG
jgi:hypothetical protein